MSSAATLVEKLDCAVGVLGVLLRTLLAALRYPFPTAARVQPSLARELARRLTRGLLDRLNIAQLQWVLPPTATVYRRWVARRAAAEGAPADAYSEPLGDDGAQLHWVGRRDATKVILHFHGGGFVMTISPGHLNFLSYLRKEVKRRTGVEVKTAFLEYTLLPQHTFPTQLRQAVRALQHILASGIAPGDIVVTGDSAGGQLALQVLAHALHAHPALPPLACAAPLAGVLPVSPWVALASAAPSFVHDDADVISRARLEAWGALVLRGARAAPLAGGAPAESAYWAEPLRAPPAWWRDTARAARAVLVVYGAWEAFRDDNAALVETMREGTAGTGALVEGAEEPQGLHIGPMLDAAAGRAPGALAQLIAGWVTERLAGQ